MGIFDLFFNNSDDKYLRHELANIEELGIDELENIKDKNILKEKLASYEYYDEDEN